MQVYTVHVYACGTALMAAFQDYLSQWCFVTVQMPFLMMKQQCASNEGNHSSILHSVLGVLQKNPKKQRNIDKMLKVLYLRDCILLVSADMDKYM